MNLSILLSEFVMLASVLGIAYSPALLQKLRQR